jgi:hypothetical protein
VLVLAAVAAFLLVAGFGTLLALHPWTGRPVAVATGLAVRADNEDSSGTTYSMEITWSGPATGPGPDDYEIFRDGNQVGTVLGTKTSFTEAGLPPSMSYSFQIIAVRAGVQSPLSAILMVHTPPLRPTGLKLARATTSSLQIAWSDPAVGPAPALYEILRDGVKIATVPGWATGYNDNGLAPDTAYTYQVVAISGDVGSPASSPLSAAQTTKPPLSAAVLNWNGAVTEKTVSVTNWVDFTPKTGASMQDTWTFTPDCPSGPCNVNLGGTVENFPVNAQLTRAGATYEGTVNVHTNYYCVSQGDVVPWKITFNVTVNAAATEHGVWTATSVSGQETIYSAAAYTCGASTAYLDVTGG